MGTPLDEHTAWRERNRQLALSFLERGERLDEAVWEQAPWVVLWRVEGDARRWLLIGTFPRSRETAIARGRLFQPDLSDDDAERWGRLPTMQGAVVSENGPARAVLRQMATAIDEVARRRGNARGLGDDAACLARWVEDDALWSERG